jgi:hypothetical protein
VNINLEKEMKKLMFMFFLSAVFFVSCDDSKHKPGLSNLLKAPTLSGVSDLGTFNFFEKFKFSDTLKTDKQPPTHVLVFEIGNNHINIEVSEYGVRKYEFVAGKGALIGYIAGQPIYVYVNTRKDMGTFIGEGNVDPNSRECVVVESLSYFVNKSFVFQDGTKTSNGTKSYVLAQVS